MLGLILATLGAFTPVAHAQSTAFTYRDYLVLLDQMDQLPVTSGPQPQIYDGIVGLIDPATNTRIGTMFVDGTMPTKRERLFMPDPLVPGASFTLEQLNLVFTAGSEATTLEAFDPGWEDQPCYFMYLKYKVLPDPTLTDQLQGLPGVDLYHFDLYRDLVHVGQMLREHHHVDGHPERFVEHWAFHTGFVFPQDVGDTLEVVARATTPDDTAEFFQDLDIAWELPHEDDWKYFAQIQYDEDDGTICTSQLSL